jgi:hypothetical protein
MKVTYELTDNEKSLLHLFKTQGPLSTGDNFSGWRGSEEFLELSRNNLIYHCQGFAGEYIRYDLTEAGHDLARKLFT